MAEPAGELEQRPRPPPASLDKLAYDASISGLSATLTSQLDPDNHLRVRKQLTANVDDEAVEIDYSISNEGGAAVSWAPWEITRVAATGVTFWPTGSTPTPGKQPLLESHDQAGHTWIDIAALPADEAKLLADGAGGWLAHVAGDSILIKQFQDLPAASAAPGEAEIEVFINTDHTYVEIRAARRLRVNRAGSQRSLEGEVVRPQAAGQHHRNGRQRRLDRIRDADSEVN